MDPETRRRDFERRAAHAAHELHVHSRTPRWRYLAVHPAADEHALLESLGMKPSECTAVDVWWDTGHDVVFLQVLSKTTAQTERDCGLYARVTGEDGMINAVVVVPGRSVTTADIESAMERVAGAGLASANARDRVSLNDRLAWIRA